MHRPEDGEVEHGDRGTGNSAYACALALFRRAAEPLDGVHPALATLLTRNAKRDEDLNLRLTDLADIAAAWQAREDHFRREAADLRRDLDVALAHAAAAERAADGMRQDVLRAERRYTARCASALSADDAFEPKTTVKRAREGRAVSAIYGEPAENAPSRYRRTA